MANVSANFTANFSSFYAAVEKAEVTLKDFGDGAEKAGTKLDRLANQFSGKQIVQQATLVAEAVERIGGVSKLTEAELARVGGTVTEASEKMRKLGMEVPANFKAITDASGKAQTATKSWTASLTDAGTLIKGFLGLQVVQSVISFGKELLADAAALQKLSAQTGISTEWLQRFQIATDDAGGSVEDIAGAIFNLNKSLAQPNTEFIKGIEALGFKIEDLRRMNPEERFNAIVKGLRSITDESKFAATGYDIFGNKLKEIMPYIKSGIDSVTDSTKVMSDETIKSLSRMSKDWATFWQQFKVKASEAYAWMADARDKDFAHAVLTGQKEMDLYAKIIDEQMKKQHGLLAGAKGPWRPGSASGPWGGDQSGLSAIGMPDASEIRDLDNAIELSIGVKKRDAEATKKQADINKEYTKSLLESEVAGAKLNDQLRAIIASLPDLSHEAQGMGADLFEGMKRSEIAFNTVQTQVEQTRSIMQKAAADGKKALQEQVDAASKALMVTLDAMNTANFMGPILPATIEAERKLTSWAEFVGQSIPKTILAAVEGGGSVLQSIGSTIGTYLLDPKQSGIGAAITNGAAALPGLIGTAVSSVLPGVGALIGPAIEGVKKLFGKMFGAEQKEVNKLRDQFIESAGGIDALRRAATEAGVTLDALMAERKKKGLQADIDAITEALKFQDAAMAALDETAKRYGFTIEELGPAMARQELDKQAQQLFKDWEVLNSAGIDTIAIATRMSDEINTYVKNASLMGTEVPAAMKPMLEKMIEMGLLTDKNDEKIGSLEESGITFAMTMSEGFKGMIDEVKKLTEAISRGLGLAITNIPQPKIKGKVEWDVDAIPAGLRSPAPSYQHGTGGFKNFGAGTPVVLHGWEAVVPRDETGGAFATVRGTASPAAGAAGAVSIVINAQGAFFDTPGDLQRLADKVNDALTAKHGLAHKQRAA